MPNQPCGILGFGAYIPYHRLTRRTIAQAYGDRAQAGEKAVAHYDEDSVTLAVEASLDSLLSCKDSVSSIKSVYLATTTPSYAEKQASVTLAAALDLNTAVRTADVSHSLRASSQAMLAALDFAAVTAGLGQNTANPEGPSEAQHQEPNGVVLVAAADTRLAGAQGALEAVLGDGAAAFLIGSGEQVIARFVSAYSIAAEQTGQWRSASDEFVQMWEDRFVARMYGTALRAAVHGLVETSGVMLSEIHRVVLPAPHARMQQEAARALGLTEEQLVPGLEQHIGHTGTAYAPMMLASALEQAQPGERILFLSFGEGCDALLFEVTEQILTYRETRENSDNRKSRSIQGYLKQADNTLAYTSYLKWKGLLPLEPGRRPDPDRPSVPAMQRNLRQNLALYGTVCTQCGTKQYPKQRVCISCQAKDEMQEYRFYGRPARISTYTVDYLAASASSPVMIAVVDFDEGGRMMLEVTDCKPEELRIGLELDLTFRKLSVAGGLHTYAWKARPKR
ncbi:OB-fold domain-containing protein [Brevibacillus dissolubilis]|uniref:OB-fold domain-containing protein n=1 Tax=Brevibacillus dissolubilis TaxID=1844116 RepID=UPI0011168072|nr:OB-fold domain-containing protein [Brevibacillus dissolubilis]